MDNHGQTQKKPRGTGFWTTAIAAALCVLAGAVSCARTETLASSGAAGPLPTVVVAPASEDMPLLVRWPEPVASPPLDTALIPEIGIEPLVEGTFTWRDSSTLSFAPVDGRWVGGERFTVSVPELSSLEGDALPPATLEVDLGYFSGGGKSADWAVQKGAYRLVSSLYLYEHDALGARPAYFLYDQAIPVKTLGKYVKVRLQNGKDVPFKVFTPKDLDKVFGVSIPEENVLAVEITSFPADGSTVVISLPDWGNVKPGSQPGSVDRSFTIARNFEIEDIAPRKLASQGRLPLIADLSVSLSRGFDMDQFRKALTIKPAPEAMDVYGWEYGQALIRLSLKPGVSYSLRVAAGLEDYLGNRLARAVDYSFRAQDLPPELVAPAYPITVEARSGSVPLKYLNLGQLTVRAYTFASASAYVQALESRVRSAQSAGLRALSAQKTYKLDSYVANERKLSDIVMENAPGFRLVEIEGSGLGSEAVEGGPKASVLYNSTAMGVTVKVHDAGILAWVASFADGKPVPGADLRLLNTAGQEVGKGVSDKNGLATLSVPEPLRGQRLYVVASLGADSAIASVRDDELSSAWQFNLAGPEKNASKLSALVYTERGAYRPAESVMIKAYVARQDVLAWKGPFTVKVVDPRGKTILDKDIQADAYGSLDTSLELGQHADVGRYSLTLGAGDRTATGEFRVEEYRVPSFMVRLEAQGEWKLDARALMGVSAAYYHGGSLEGRAYWYRVTRESAPLSLSRYPGYVFGLALPSDEAGTFLQGDGRLDGSGKTVVVFDPHHSAEAGRVRYTVEVRVQDVDNQAYVGLASKVVDSTTLYVGHLPPVRSVLKSNERLRLPLVVVNKDGSPVAGTKIEISWDRIEYHQTSRVYAQDSVQTTNRPVSAASGTATLTSRDVPVAWNYLPPTAGVYKVRASVRDPATGAYASTETVVTVGGDETAGWPRFDMERIDVVRDKDSYVSGDTARLVVESPYDTAVGLLCIERDRVLEAKLISFDGDTPVIELPIKDHYAPNVYVSVVIVRGRAHFQKDALGYETGAPGFKLGYVELPVSPESKRLSAEFTGLKDVYQPGSRIRLPVTIKDAAGRPVQAQFAVAVVDEAVLALTGYRTPDPLPPLYKPAGLSVRTAASWLDLPHSRRERFEAIFPGGGGGDDPAASRSDLDAALRRLFKSTAYWNPAVKTDSAGRATLEFTVPDNITSYRIMVTAADGKGSYGNGQASFTSDKPLSILPVSPRFSYPGDEFDAGVILYNKTGADAAVSVKGVFEGVGLVSGQAARVVQVKAGTSATVLYRVKAGTVPGSAKLRFSASAGGASDAAEFTLPVLDPGVLKTEVLSFTGSGSSSYQVTLPQGRVPGTLELEVALSSTPLSELKDAVQYLMQYPNGCIEQTTSTAYPLVVLKDLIPAIGVDVDMAKLKEFSEAGIKRILAFQTSAGGLSYWPGSDQPHAFATAFGLTALIEAKKQGYDVPDASLERMADYLEAALREGKISGEMPHGSVPDGDTRALFVMTLGRLGRPQPQYVQTLWRERKNLTPFGVSFLAIAVRESPQLDQSLLEPMLAYLREASETDTTEAWYEGGRAGGYSMDSPLRSHGSALIAYAMAAKDDELTSKLLAGLLARRQEGYGIWGNTQENVFGIMGVYELVKTGASGASFSPSIQIGSFKLGSAQMESADRRIKIARIRESDLGSAAQGSSLTLKISGMPAASFVTVRVGYRVPIDKAIEEPTSSGFTYTRVYETLDGSPLDLNAIPAGSLVRVRLFVKNPEHRNYVAIDDKLPAGLEAQNAALATTGSLDMGELSPAALRARSVLSYQEIRDARVAFFVDDMLPGEYEFVYLARATVAGTFLRPAGRVEAMYETDVNATTGADIVTVQ